MGKKGLLPPLKEWATSNDPSRDEVDEGKDKYDTDTDSHASTEPKTPERKPEAADRESMRYWDKVRDKLTPLPDLQKSLETIEKACASTGTRKKRFPKDDGLHRHTPKLADLDVKELEEQIHRVDLRSGLHDIRVTHDFDSSRRVLETMISPYSDFGPYTSPLLKTLEMKGIRGDSPLAKFMSVPMDTLPSLKKTNSGATKIFPAVVHKEAAMRTRKAMTGTSFVDIEDDSKQYDNPFPILTLKDSQKRRKKSGAASQSPRSTITSDKGEHNSDPKKSAIHSKYSSRFNFDEASLAALSQKFGHQSSFGVTSVTEPLSTGRSTHVSAKSSKFGFQLNESSQPKKEPKRVVEEEEKVELFPVRKKEDLDEIARILDHDAGLVSTWRSDFIDNQDHLASKLNQKLEKRKIERDKAYHNRAILTKVIKIVHPTSDLHIQRKQDNIWREAKVKLKKDRSSFPTRKAFYTGLLSYIEQEGGLRSDKDERVLYSIKKRMDEGFPVNRRLVYDMAREIGMVILQEPDYKPIFQYLCRECDVTPDDLSEYITKHVGYVVEPVPKATGPSTSTSVPSYGQKRRSVQSVVIGPPVALMGLNADEEENNEGSLSASASGEVSIVYRRRSNDVRLPHLPSLYE